MIKKWKKKTEWNGWILVRYGRLVAVQGGKTSDKRIKNLVNEISLLRLTANYKDGHGEKASAELLAQTHFSHGDKHIKVLSSTHQPRVHTI